MFSPIPKFNLTKTLCLTGFMLVLCLSHANTLWAKWLRPIHHEISITLDTMEGTAKTKDLITLHLSGDERESLEFLLHRDFEITHLEVPHKGIWNITQMPDEMDGTRVTRIHIEPPEPGTWPDFLEIHFDYTGPYRDLQRSPEQTTPRENDTLLLAGESYFYPVLDAPEDPPLMTYSLETVTPPGWQSITQGKRISKTDGEGRIVMTWKCNDPMEEIYLVADRFNEYKEELDDISLYVFLKGKDDALAQRYFKAARSYIRFYEKLIGPYPYIKFAVVENSHQTGYAMPSFTLLGSRVIRFPFILHTSFPHEILHNWWGNGVFVKRDSGNWSEGLTAYLSDHLFPDLAGKGDQVRFLEMMKHMNYVNEDNDFPLKDFRYRTDMATQAVGYGKWLMVLNMLRQKVGDKLFLKSLREFFITYRFKRAGFEELRSVFEITSGQNLSLFFKLWTEQTGAPALMLMSARAEPFAKEFAVEFTLTQKQRRPIFPLQIPVMIWHEGRPEPVLKKVILDTAEKSFRLFTPSVPKAILIDPYNDVFRRLSRDEVPASIGQTYGSETWSTLISENVSDEMKQAYIQFKNSLGDGEAGIESDEGRLPNNNLWIMGRNNSSDKKLISWLNMQAVGFKQNGVTLDGKTFPWKDHAFVFTLPHPESKSHSITWLIADRADSMKGLIRKLPHYGKYGYLVFEGKEPTNRAKGLWPPNRMGLMKVFKPGNYHPPHREPLVDFLPE